MMSDTDKKNFYAIIPANVRYDKRLTANAKLLYGEITALCNEKGYCWATNDYFANLYEVSKQSISHWIKQLCDYGYIKSDLIYREGSKEIKARYLTLLLGGTIEKYATPTVEKFKDNTTSLNTTENNTTKEENTPEIPATVSKPKRVKKVKEEKKVYGTFKNVFLSDTDYNTLKEAYTENVLLAGIEAVSVYLQKKPGKHYTDFNRVMLSWGIDAGKEAIQTGKYSPFRNSSFSENREPAPEFKVECCGNKISRYRPFCLVCGKQFNMDGTEKHE